MRKKRRLAQMRFDNLDAAENAFFRTALEQVQATVYMQRFPQLRAREFVPVNNSVPPGIRTVTFRQYNQVGIAQLISSYADDLPRSDVLSTEFSTPIKDAGDSYGYNVREIRAAAAAGTPLEQMKANAARRAMEVLFDRIIAKGDSATGLLGLINQPNALSYIPPNGAADSATWATKTPAEIVADVVGLIETVPTQTNEVEAVNTVLMPRAQYVQLRTTRMNEFSETTILEWLQEMYPGVNFDRWLTLAGAGSGGTDRVIGYDRNPNALEAIIPQEFEQLPAQPRNLEFIVPCLGAIGGVVCYLPLSMVVADGV